MKNLNEPKQKDGNRGWPDSRTSLEHKRAKKRRNRIYKVKRTIAHLEAIAKELGYEN